MEQGLIHTPGFRIDDDVAVTASQAIGWSRPPLIIKDQLCTFLDEQGLGEGSLHIERLGNGHSCEIFLLRRSGFEGVLRRAPRPPWSPGVHNIEREAAVLTALEGSARVPRILVFCESHDVIGAPFVIQERVPGMVVTGGLPVLLNEPEQRRRIGEELIDALAELHDCDVNRLGMANMGRSSIDHVKHVQRLTDIWSRNALRAVEDMDWLGGWLRDNAPVPSKLGIVHGDYRLGNVLYGVDAPARLVAILDWETVILGDPLIDLGYVLGTYRDVGDDHGFLRALTPVALGEGALTRGELAKRYAERSSRSLENLHWYLAFSLWKTAVVGEGLQRRLVEGLSQDSFYREFKDGVPELALRARQWASGSSRLF